MIVLVGFMGAGKSTVGRLLAAKLDTAFADTDSVIQERAGHSVREIFESQGETAFRELERATVRDLLDGGAGVVALGGGALGSVDTRSYLAGRSDVTVVYLDVDHDVALERVGGDARRPMLALGDLESLHSRRRELYEEVADVTVRTSSRTPDEVVRRIEAATSTMTKSGIRTVSVPVAPRPYEVVVGSGIAERIGEFMPAVDRAEQAFLVTHPELLPIAERTASSLRSAGLRTTFIDVPSGESSKSLETMGLIYDRLGKEAAHRRDIIVGVGGGVITDIAGFVASTFNRGMPVVHVPTSLLGQVDAAIGGKTGINLDHGKNLVGTFHQPMLVLCDVALLAGLPVEELRAGTAEVVKYGFIAAPDLLRLVESRADSVLSADPGVLIDIVERSAAIKAGVVAADEREEGDRALLNYGHTFAHAIEHLSGYGGIRHGEAVAIGMMAAAHLGYGLGRFEESVVESHRRVLGALGLPFSASLDIDDMERAWLRDKKYQGGVRFVLLKAIGEAESGISAPRPVIEDALERLST